MATTDDEREALKTLIYTFETTDLGDNLAITTRDAYALADAILAARKHPEPEITDEMVERAARQMHMRAAGVEGRKSWDETTDRIRQGWRDAARDALEAALRVSVGEKDGE